MYCPVDFTFPIFTLEMKAMKRSKRLFVSLTIFML